MGARRPPGSPLFAERTAGRNGRGTLRHSVGRKQPGAAPGGRGGALPVPGRRSQGARGGREWLRRVKPGPLFHFLAEVGPAGVGWASGTSRGGGANGGNPFCGAANGGNPFCGTGQLAAGGPGGGPMPGSPSKGPSETTGPSPPQSPPGPRIRLINWPLPTFWQPHAKPRPQAAVRAAQRKRVMIATPVPNGTVDGR